MFNPRTKISVISNGLNPPFDEGIKKFANQFVRALSNISGIVLQVIPIHAQHGWLKRKLFLDLEIRRLLLKFSPNLVFYIPTSSGSLAAFLRFWILRSILGASSGRAVMLLLQPNEAGYWGRILIRAFSPDLILTQSDAAYNYYASLQIPVDFTSAGVDVEEFAPSDGAVKASLRKKYGFAEDDFIVLHVGHIKRSRNLESLASVSSKVGAKVVVVGSTSTVQDQTLRTELQDAGVRVYAEYVERIQEFYQMADCYVFPTVLDTAAIGAPLSVLEAMACNLPVVTTKFGRLPKMFSEGDGFKYFDRESELSPSIGSFKIPVPIKTREMVLDYSWNRLVLDAISKGSRT